ncbi:adenosylcobinamide-GDP ribazoletransferase [Dechloromonas agitata]|uniref:adenosylcobinamide-GDP ribazoletransferase n=1 Tax=Dechloromonas agitata TaxID=73030 RepID=UPI00237DF480|nr:adenosylcobinamide-GDP ribazoletransferase [Dechloromonas agitata]MDE1546651.1 adenosylcobinamide-GDP ribazoletransferase [Dechloromonas agitata]
MIRRELGYFLGAVGFFTRLPVPGWVGHSAAALSQCARYFPAVGLLVGGIGALVYWLALHLWPQPVAVLLSMAATLYATGAFHEDGLSDTADGLGGAWDKARILAIMKDSRVGSYGVVALVLALLGKFALLSGIDAALVPAALLAGHAVSRFGATLIMATLDYARDDESSKSRPATHRPSLASLLLAAGFALLPLLLLPLGKALAGIVLAALAATWLAAKFQRWLGGYTGDCLGAVQQVTEILFYLGLMANLGAPSA